MDVSRLSGLDAAKPRFFGILELAHRVWHVFRERARGELAQLMTADAAIVLHQVQPLGLGTFAGILPLPPNSLASGIFSIEYQ